MLALSSSLYSNYGSSWPLEEKDMSQVQNTTTLTPKVPFLNKNSGETEEALDSSALQFPSLQTQHLEYFPSSANTNDPSLIKKLNHNASERDRRKKLNTLYASLRSILPGADQMRKLSIPTTISPVLKYIPELQNQVEKLKQRKQEILSSIHKKGYRTRMDNLSNGIVGRSLPIVSVSQIGEREVMIQICSCKNMRSSVSEILANLEEEGLEVFNVSASASSGEVVFYNLHLQIREKEGLNWELLSQKLLSKCENREDQLLF
ncbi:transcription factor ORG2-like [Macadamia integrifolia]|uniref:transcription factor ORG2-like n=1 Tax=Macadamia integrifolia TaxID=60698 RepID=UPI001C4EE50A|nr:transcription factor ORG2-like [Macadamia integrifolia]